MPSAAKLPSLDTARPTPIRIENSGHGATSAEPRGGAIPASRAAVSNSPVVVENLVKAYGAVLAVRNVSFAVEPGTTVTLLGPSGCGKTTTLRCIAGLEVPTAGRITIGNKIVFDDKTNRFIEPEKRNIGMVFQSYAIWPHMTVGGNVGFPLKISGAPAAEIAEKTAAILKLVGLGDLSKRSAAALSGGQQQRVALARALVHQPAIVLFDEPLSNLDANLRERMRTELQLLQNRLGFTAIFVTHDQEEALALSDNVIIMRNGIIEQDGSPREVFQNPRTEFTARFLGYSNVVNGHVRALLADGNVDVEAGSVVLRAKWRSSQGPQEGEEACVAFRADRVAIAPAGSLGGQNVFAGRIATASFLGSYIDYTALVGDEREIKIEGPVDSAMNRGEDIDMQVAAVQCHAFRREA